MLTVSVLISGAGWLPSGVSEPPPPQGYGSRSSLPFDKIRNLTATPGVPNDHDPSEGSQSYTLSTRFSLNKLSWFQLPLSLMNEYIHGFLEDDEHLRQPTSAIYTISTLELVVEQYTAIDQYTSPRA